VNHQKTFIDQAQVSGVSPIRRPVPIPQPGRNLSSSVFNLNQQSAFQQPSYQPQQNQWGINPMGQVRRNLKSLEKRKFILTFPQAQSMAHLNMMGNQWNMPQQQGWPGNHFNGSNMSLNMHPNGFMNHNDQQIWNPWMQQQQQFGYPNPMMPNGEDFSIYDENLKKTEHFQFCFIA
jgi:hypothetical protein